MINKSETDKDANHDLLGSVCSNEIKVFEIRTQKSEIKPPSFLQVRLSDPTVLCASLVLQQNMDKGPGFLSPTIKSADSWNVREVWLVKSPHRRDEDFTSESFVCSGNFPVLGFLQPGGRENSSVELRAGILF